MEFSELPFLPNRCTFEHRSDGTTLITPGYQLGQVWPSIPHLFLDRAKEFPDRPVVARRELLADGSRGAWRRLAYGEAAAQARAFAQALIDRRLEASASVLVLSGANLNHLVVNLGAQMAHVPYAPLSVNYSLAGGDFARLRHCATLCRPRVIYADDWRTFLPAMRALAAETDALLVSDEASPDGETMAFAEFLSVTPTPEVDRLIAALTPDTHAKTIFTSGSTGKPKGVIQTQRMLTGVVAQHQGMYARHESHPGDSAHLSWTPWSHVGGNNILLADVINEAGCLYIDDGRPLPGQFGESIRNLRELRLREYNSTPIFFSELVTAMEADDALRAHFFSELQFLSYGAAGLSEDLFRRLQAQAIAATGRQIPIIAKYGTSETQGTTIASWPIERTGPIGLPFPGNVVKLAPVGDKIEIRVKGVTVTPGYLDNAAATAAAFDSEGYYCTGDAARWIDAQQPQLGLEFDGRVSENFKLQSGTWVHVGELRFALLDNLDPLLQDVVIAGEGRADVRALGWMRLADARKIAKAALDADVLARHPEIVAHVSHCLAHYNAQTSGQSRRITALRILVTAPRGDEIADKGYINQREVLRQRAEDVSALYRGEAIFAGTKP